MGKKKEGKKETKMTNPQWSPTQLCWQTMHGKELPSNKDVTILEDGKLYDNILHIAKEDQKREWNYKSGFLWT